MNKETIDTEPVSYVSPGYQLADDEQTASEFWLLHHKLWPPDEAWSMNNKQWPLDSDQNSILSFTETED